MAALHITDIESAINWWRDRSPSPDGISACPEVRALAEVYALMVYDHRAECDEHGLPPRAREAWLAWYASTPDSPCIAICSTSQGDACCKGCGRSFDEVRRGTDFLPFADEIDLAAVGPVRWVLPRPQAPRPGHARHNG